MSIYTDNPPDAIVAILERYVYSAAECWYPDERLFRVAWTTQYDGCGELIYDPVEELLSLLPAGWSAWWTGEGNGDEEDFIVARDRW